MAKSSLASGFTSQLLYAACKCPKPANHDELTHKKAVHTHTHTQRGLHEPWSHLNVSSAWGMTDIVHGAHFGLSLFPKAHPVGLDLHVAAACSTHESSVTWSYTCRYGHTWAEAEVQCQSNISLLTRLVLDVVLGAALWRHLAQIHLLIEYLHLSNVTQAF